MINGLFPSNRPLEVIKTTIQLYPKFGKGIMNLSCNMQWAK